MSTLGRKMLVVGDLSVSERCDVIWKDLTTASKEDVEKIQQAPTEQSESSCGREQDLIVLQHPNVTML